MTDHIKEPLQVAGDGQGRLRLWAYLPGQSAVIVANFNSSHVLSVETKRANARRAAACWNFCAGLSTEEIERRIKLALLAR